jgi:hypothetical protein
VDLEQQQYKTWRSQINWTCRANDEDDAATKIVDNTNATNADLER